jgi:hypothetical protein
MHSGLISSIKNRLVHEGNRTYVVPLGLYRGITSDRYSFQRQTDRFYRSIGRQLLKQNSILELNQTDMAG